MNHRTFGLGSSRISPTARGSLFYLGISSASATFFPFITVFYADRGLSGREIGLLTAIGPVVALLAAPLLVALADRRGWQMQMMIAGLAGVALTTLLLPLAQPFAVPLALVGVSGLTGSTLGSVSDGAIAQMAIRRRINYGKMRLWGSARAGLRCRYWEASCGHYWPLADVSAGEPAIPGDDIRRVAAG